MSFILFDFMSVLCPRKSENSNKNVIRGCFDLYIWILSVISSIEFVISAISLPKLNTLK